MKIFHIFTMISLTFVIRIQANLVINFCFKIIIIFFVKIFHPCRPTNYIPMIIYERPCIGGVMIYYCTIQLNIDFLISTYNIQYYNI